MQLELLSPTGSVNKRFLKVTLMLMIFFGQKRKKILKQWLIFEKKCSIRGSTLQVFQLKWFSNMYPRLSTVLKSRLSFNVLHFTRKHKTFLKWCLMWSSVNQGSILDTRLELCNPIGSLCMSQFLWTVLEIHIHLNCYCFTYKTKNIRTYFCSAKVHNLRLYYAMKSRASQFYWFSKYLAKMKSGSQKLLNFLNFAICAKTQNSPKIMFDIRTS